MTTSEVEATVLPSSVNHSHGTVLIDIIEKLPEEKIDDGGFSVCRVPLTLRSAKPKAFTPQFVGIGPYHHFDADLPITDELKLGMAKKVHVEHVSNIDVSDTEIQAYYAMDMEVDEDGHNARDSSTNAHVLTVDGLFLWTLLHSHFRYPFHFFLTGKHYRKPPVSGAGEELSMEGLIRDVFKLENQIPTSVLKMIIVSIGKTSYLGPLMLDFCRTYSPLAVDSRRLSKTPQDHDHLLELMYNMIAPEPHIPSSEFNYCSCVFLGLYLPVVLLTYMFCLFSWIILWILVYAVVVALQPFLKIIRFILVKVIPWSGAIFEQPKIEFPTLRHFLDTVHDWFLNYVLFDKTTFRLGYIYQASDFDQSTDDSVPAIYRFFCMPWISRNVPSFATIPSATELKNMRIQFKRVESDVSSVKFDEAKWELHLPCIELDATSEVILRNLAAYESLIKIHHDNNRRQNFSHYIELMSALVQTQEDVKLLMHEKIILTQLNAEAVIQIFKMPLQEPAGKHARQTPDLHSQLMNFKPKLDAINNLYLMLTEFLRICVIGGVILLFSPLLAEGFRKLWCSTIFADSSPGYCIGNQVVVGDSGGNNFNIISSSYVS